MSSSQVSEKIQIRSATVEDVGIILKFIRELAVYEKLEQEVVCTEEDLKATLFGEPKFAEVLLLEEQGQPAGFALFFHNYSTFLGRPGIHLEDLFVLPEHRGRGFGKMLLGAVARVALERNCGRLEWNVLDWNEPAIRFYQSLGAKAMSEWTGYRLTGTALQDFGKARPSQEL